MYSSKRLVNFYFDIKGKKDGDIQDFHAQTSAESLWCVSLSSKGNLVEKVSVWTETKMKFGEQVGEKVKVEMELSSAETVI